MKEINELLPFLNKPFILQATKYQFEKVDDDIIIARFSYNSRDTYYAATVVEATPTGIKYAGTFITELVLGEIHYSSLKSIGI